MSDNYRFCGECENDRKRVGYAYIPYQKRLGQVYSPQKAIMQGTIFPELDHPIGVYERGLCDGK